MKKSNISPPNESLFRYSVVSQVVARELRGEVRSQAVKKVASISHTSPNCELCKVTGRTIYRWLSAYEEKGFEGLLPKKRAKTENSIVLPHDLLEYFKDQKTQDPHASIPELIRRAKQLHLTGAEQADRVTVWRSLNRMGVATSNRKTIKMRDSRRFAYPHRMNMILCDGKQFRAGIKRLRRVALFFIDDATRYVLDVVVGTSENAELFLRGLHRVLLSYGLMSGLFVDNGPGFIANDVIEVAGKLNILFIHGTPAYPEGHGKIERFNQTVQEQLLRYLSNNPEIDAKCSALELRLRHYITEQYRHAPHEGIDGDSPWNRFNNDTLALKFHKNREQLDQAFVLHHNRRVSFDNVISQKSVKYEVPRGYAGTRITIHCNLLKNTVSIIHQGRLMKLSAVDLHANARSRRAKVKSQPKEVTKSLPKSSAQIAFDRDFKPVVDAGGNFNPIHLNEEEL